jgi:hypothetical protein
LMRQPLTAKMCPPEGLKQQAVVMGQPHWACRVGYALSAAWGVDKAALGVEVGAVMCFYVLACWFAACEQPLPGCPVVSCTLYLAPAVDIAPPPQCMYLALPCFELVLCAGCAAAAGVRRLRLAATARSHGSAALPHGAGPRIRDAARTLGCPNRSIHSPPGTPR